MNGQRNDPTQDELDFMFRHGFIWLDNNPNQWLFQKDEIKYDLSAADILQIDDIEKNGRFIYNRQEAA